MSSEEFSLSEVNKPDFNNLSVLAKKHTPIIEAPDTVKAGEPFTVKIKIGGIDGVEHPNILGHWVSWVTLYAGSRLISKVEFYPELTDGYEVQLKISLNDSAELKAFSFCNLHGVWEGKPKKVSVTK